MFDNFSVIIRDLRTKHNLTQEDLARKLEVSLSTVNRWERGDGSIPASKNLVDICLLFGVSLNDLAGLNMENVIAIDMLTPDQQKLLEALVVEFQDEKRVKSSLNARQNQIIQMLFNEFRG